jgi:hypothetical protein
VDKTKYLLFAAVVGYLSWMVSEVVEIVHGGPNATGYYLTAVFHLFSGIGIWGLHLVQNRSKNTLSAVGTVMVSLSYLSIVYLPIQVMNSGLSGADFVDANPMYMIPAFVNVIGLIVFGSAVIRTKFFPAWTGAIVIFGSIIFIVAMTNGFQLVANVNNITLSATVMYMCMLGYRQLKQGAA